jgi:hypothetical protein
MDPEEYERRVKLMEEINLLSKSEKTEILRIVHTNGGEISENREGTRFDLAKASQEICNDIVRFLQFVKTTNIELAKRDNTLP